MWSDLTFGPSFKVKRWFTGFGELSFRWIQICISSMRRSSYFYLNVLFHLKTNFTASYFVLYQLMLSSCYQIVLFDTLTLHTLCL